MSLDNKPDIHAVDDDGFCWACRMERLPVVKYLMTLCDDYQVEFDLNGKIVDYKVIHDWTKELKNNCHYTGIGTCNICDEERKTIYGMKCDSRHEMCVECYGQLKEYRNVCPYCGKEI
jgi:hypothetical protein